MTLIAGTRLGPYDILMPLGAGGMGVVYKARDPRLDRLVAIKVLPPDATREEHAKQRFVREARAASALDHPNICAIHEIDETVDGQLYLVMAYYDGETLQQKIARGPLVLDEALDVAIQERVSRAIVKALHVTLSPDEDRRVAERPIEDVRAYECYLRARHEIWRLSQEGLDRALALLRHGLELVGDNALLYGTLGAAYWQHINAGVGTVEDHLRKAEECVVKVFQLEPDSAPGHYLQGLIRLTRGNLQEAVREIGRALVLDPDNSEALFMHAALLTTAGKGSTAEAARLLEIDPLTPHNLLVPAWGHLMQGRFSLAVDQCRRWHELEPESPLAALFLGDALARHDRVDDAEAAFERLAARFPQTMFGQIGLFLGQALRGNKVQALAAVSPTSAAAARWDLQYSWDMATGYALIDEREEALEWLENATRRGFINHPFLDQYDPLLKNIRQERRFKELMEEVRSRWERFEV